MFEKYQRTAQAEIRPVTKDDIEEFKAKGSISAEGSNYDVAIPEAELANGSPYEGDMIARNPSDHNDQWLIGKDYFMANFCKVVPTGEISDGYHTFDELYDFRMVYNAALFNEWAKENKDSKEVREGHNELFNDTIKFKPKFNVHKSWKHHDGEDCFGGGWFIVSAMLPTGLISNHYEAKYWDMFKIPEEPKALFPFDGHTSNDVLNRIKDSLLSNGV